ncbi:MAG TPA: alpha/beta hydrolase family protein [Humisphaera sp.]
MRATRSLAVCVTFLLLLAPVAPRASAEPATRPATQPSRVVRVTELPLKLDGVPAQQANWLRAFTPHEAAFDATIREAAPDEAWRFFRVSFESPVKTPWPENNVVPCELYLPPKPAPAGQKLPAAIVLDILDGSAVIPRGIARGLAEQGVAAIYVPMACYGVRRPANGAHFAYYAEHPEETVGNMRQTVMDVRRAKAVLAALPEVDADRISITGVSLGGIMTSLIAGVDGQFYRVVPILAGGDIAAITFHARETRRIREACTAKGIDQEKLAEMLRPVDPLTFAARIRPDTCLMINASKDEVIPLATTVALNKAIGNPTMLMVPAGHYGAGLFLPSIRRGVIDFLLGRKVERLEF